MILALALAAIPPAATPLPPDMREAARHLLAATGAVERRGPAIDAAIERMVAIASGPCVAVQAPPSARGCRQRLAEATALRARAVAKRAEIEAEVADVQERAYAGRLSVADMEATAAFARTPAGKAFFAQAGLAATEAAIGVQSVVLDQVDDALLAEDIAAGRVVEMDK